MSLTLISPKLQPLIQRAARSQGLRTMTVLSKQSGEEYKKMNYSARMKETGRPVSPHVTIYAFPVAAIASITNRVTGCALSFGAAGLAAIEIVAGPGASLELMQTVGSQGFLVSGGVKFVVSFPIVYHYLGATRHLVWDYVPAYLETAAVEKSSMALFGGSTLLSAGLMFL